MSIRSESLPYRGRLSRQLEDLLRRNGMNAQLAVEDGKYKLLVQGHDSPLLSYDISEQQFRALGEGGTNYANKKAYNVFKVIEPEPRNMAGRFPCLPMLLAQAFSDGHLVTSQASIFADMVMCRWLLNMLTVVRGLAR